MSLTSGIEQQAARSLTSVHHVSPPRPSIELRRVKHTNTEPDTRDVASVRGDDLEGSSTERNRAVAPEARKRLEIQYCCLCLALFLAGWNDGTTGPLIPTIRRYYNVCPVLTLCSSSILIRSLTGQLHACISRLYRQLRGKHTMGERNPTT